MKKYAKIFLLVLGGTLSFYSQGQKAWEKDLKVAEAFFEKNSYHQALVFFTRSNHRKRSVEVMRKQIVCMMALNDFEGARKVSKKVYELSKSSADALNCFEATFRLGDYQEAKELVGLIKKPTEREKLIAMVDSAMKWQDTPKEVVVKPVVRLNSPYAEFSPVPYKDKLVFSSSREGTVIKAHEAKTDEAFFDLYVAQKDNRNRWAVKGSFSSEINTLGHEGAVSFTADGKEIVYERSDRNTGSYEDRSDINHMKLYKSSEKGLGWEKPLWFYMNDSLSSFRTPFFTKNGEAFFFASDMPGGQGGMDLFLCYKVDSLWSAPVNLGPEVNTPGDEMYPFFEDGKLTFSSNGHIGMGGFDFFSAELTNGDFINVHNMGMPINTSYDEISLYWWDESTAYFSSNRKGGQGGLDIFKLMLPTTSQ